MADNTTLNTGTGGDVINTDDIGGVKTQVIKPGYGALDSLTLVSTSNGLPVQVASGADAAEGALTDAAWDGSASSASVIAILKLIAIRGGATPVFV